MKNAISISMSSLVCGHLFIYPTPNMIYNRVEKSVVTITSMTIKKDPFSEKFIQVPSGTGSGFSYIKPNYIITNSHVVHDSFNIKVSSDNQEFDAKLIGEDSRHDIALLEVDHEFKPLHACDTDPQIGDPVLAIGNPFGFDNSMSSGIISGLHRDLDGNIPYFDMIQIDAAINPGNSGGVLLNGLDDCVIGMNTAIISPNGANTGVGFSIPVHEVKEFAENIINNISPFQLGVALLPQEFSEMLGIQGAIVSDVIPDSLAEKIGIIGTSRDMYGIPIMGDIIVGINDFKILKNSDVFKYLNLDNLQNITIIRPNIGLITLAI